VEIQRRLLSQIEILALKGNLDTAACMELRPLVTQIVESGKNELCLDFTSTQEADPAGLKFLRNLCKIFASRKKQIHAFGASSQLGHKLNQLEEWVQSVQYYKSNTEFENSFADQYALWCKKLFTVAQGGALWRSVNLRCPLCRHEGFSGFLLNLSGYEETWEEEDITPQWKALNNSENSIEWEVYEVAVCPSCLFAARRLNFFEVIMPEGGLEHCLTAENLESLEKIAIKRRGILGPTQEKQAKYLFGAPRERSMAYPAWKLFEITLRGLQKGRKMENPLELAHANILLAKFAPSQGERKEALSTAYVWLQDMIGKYLNYSKKDLARAYVYAVSVGLALDRNEDVRSNFEKYQSQCASDTAYDFYTQRMESLVHSLRH